MQNIAIFPVVTREGARSFRAVSENGLSEGRTVGEALDAVAESFLTAESGAVVVIQPFLPDSLFTGAQQARLEELMNRWRLARDGKLALAPAEQEELQRLVNAELQAAIHRTEQIPRG